MKKHHPDIVGSVDSDGNKFRDVMEAYGVLSVSESRANYDLSRKKNPDAYADVSEAEWEKTSRPDLRDAKGNIPAAAPSPSAESYAAERLAELKMQRKKYNVNDLGFYRGGLPKKNRGPMRGTALGNPGEYHQPTTHNFLDNYCQDSKVVTPEDAVKFKHWMNSDKTDFNRTKPFYPAHYDKDFQFMKDRSYWLSLILLFGFASWGSAKLQVELDRQQMWTRMQDLTNLPAHHFHNRGGVLIQKNFIGFEKYHRNMDEMLAWYKKAYPAVMG